MEEDFVLKQTFLSRKPQNTGSYAGLITLILVFAASAIYWENFQNLSAWLPANRLLIYEQHEYWRIFSAIFIHSDLGHFLSNAPALVFLSSLLYGYYGAGVFPVLMILLSGIVNAISIWTYSDEVRLVGASGLVYCMAGFWLAMYLGVERRYSFWVRLMRCAGFTLVMLFPTTLEQHVSYRTHAIGFAAGTLAAIVYYRKHRIRFREAEVYELE